MRSIEEKSGAEKIDIAGAATGRAKVTVTGETSAALVAKRAILELAEKGYARLIAGEDFKEAIVKVEPRNFATIIGPGGSTIRAIQDTLKVRLNIPKRTGGGKTSSIPGARGSRSAPAKVTIAGPREGVDKAKATIEHLLRYQYSSLSPWPNAR